MTELKDSTGINSASTLKRGARPALWSRSFSLPFIFLIIIAPGFAPAAYAVSPVGTAQSSPAGRKKPLRKAVAMPAAAPAAAPAPVSASQTVTAPAGALSTSAVSGLRGQLRWEQEWGPLVPHKTFPRDCSLCHLPSRWDVILPDFKFDHLKKTGYALEGAHSEAACLRCHNDRGPAKTYSARGCAGCHVDPHRSSLGRDCKRCHNQNTWERRTGQGTQIADHARTRFPLTGRHAILRCEECHLNAAAGDFQGASKECYLCHQTEYASAPGHTGPSYTRDCTTCHKTTAWAGAGFKHSPGATNCVSCHLANYQSAPNHAAKSYAQACAQCHNQNSWLGAAFVHSPTMTNCSSCHLANYQAAPNHAAKSYSQACTQCHSQNTWLGAVFVHAPSMTDCVSCHLANFQAAPNHAAKSYPQTCTQCHTQATWLGAAFVHSGSMTNCVSCHHADFTAAASPVNHLAQGIIENACSQCHTNSGSPWQPTSYNHGNCYDDVTHKAHENARCVQCHPADYTAATCTACHKNRSSCD